MFDSSTSPDPQPILPQQVLSPSGRPPKFMMLDKTDLSVDHSYQRDGDKKLSVTEQNYIAKNWNSDIIGVLLVSPRLSGKFMIIDGQNRWKASNMLENIKSLPCCVVYFDKDFSDAQRRIYEAELYRLVNTTRINPTQVELQKAGVVCKDEMALIIHDLCKKNGFAIEGTGSKPMSICFVGTLREYINRYGKEEVGNILAFGAKLLPKHALSNRVFKLIAFYRNTPVRVGARPIIDDNVFWTKLEEWGEGSIAKVIESSMLDRRRSNVRDWANTVIDLVNEKVGRNKFSLY